MYYKKIFALLLAFLLLFVATGCSLFDLGNEKETSSSEEESVETEDLEYPVSAFGAALDSRPGVVVSLSPSLTDKIYELKLDDRLSGVSDYCESQSGSPVRCGTAQILDLEEIEALSPHLVLTETPLAENDLIALQQMGAEVAVIPRANNINALLENYKGIARLFDGEQTGTALGESFCGAFTEKLDSLAQAAPAEPPKVLYLRLLTYTVATGDTLENELMQKAGLQNIAASYTDWTYPEEIANGDGRKDFEAINFIYCDKRSVTMPMLERSAFYKGLDAVLKDRYLYIDSYAFERQSLKMLEEIGRMQQYANGEIPGSADEK